MQSSSFNTKPPSAPLQAPPRQGSRGGGGGSPGPHYKPSPRKIKIATTTTPSSSSSAARALPGQPGLQSWLTCYPLLPTAATALPQRCSTGPQHYLGSQDGARGGAGAARAGGGGEPQPAPLPSRANEAPQEGGGGLRQHAGLGEEQDYPPPRSTALQVTQEDLVAAWAALCHALLSAERAVLSDPKALFAQLLAQSREAMGEDRLPAALDLFGEQQGEQEERKKSSVAKKKKRRKGAKGGKKKRLASSSSCCCSSSSCSSDGVVNRVEGGDSGQSDRDDLVDTENDQPEVADQPQQEEEEEGSLRAAEEVVQQSERKEVLGEQQEEEEEEEGDDLLREIAALKRALSDKQAALEDLLEPTSSSSFPGEREKGLIEVALYQSELEEEQEEERGVDPPGTVQEEEEEVVAATESLLRVSKSHSLDARGEAFATQYVVAGKEEEEGREPPLLSLHTPAMALTTTSSTSPQSMIALTSPQGGIDYLLADAISGAGGGGKEEVMDNLSYDALLQEVLRSVSSVASSSFALEDTLEMSSSLGATHATHRLQAQAVHVPLSPIGAALATLHEHSEELAAMHAPPLPRGSTKSGKSESSSTKRAMVAAGGGGGGGGGERLSSKKHWQGQEEEEEEEVLRLGGALDTDASLEAFDL
eukprot:scaffold2549_cov177-Ochromonas_danica.AAC.17